MPASEASGADPIVSTLDDALPARTYVVYEPRFLKQGSLERHVHDPLLIYSWPPTSSLRSTIASVAATLLGDRHLWRMDVSWDKVRELATEYAVPLALRVLFVLVLLGFGRVIARAITRVVDRALERNHADVSLRRFVGDILSVVMLGVVILVALDTFGVKTTAIVAVLGAAGLAIGLALQGSLSNFAAGVMLIMLRPYRVADLVMLGKYIGRVDAIRVFHTVVITSDNRQVTIPNGQILQQPIENLTVLGCRRLDLVITIADVAELDVVARQLEAIAIDDARIERTPLAEVAEVNELGAKFYLRTWTKSEAFSDLAMTELVRIRGALRGTYPKFTAAVAPP